MTVDFEITREDLVVFNQFLRQAREYHEKEFPELR